MEKKKVLFHTDFSILKTGFSRHIKSLLTYLYKLDKYDIVHYCIGLDGNNPALSRTPWRSVGGIPIGWNEQEENARDPNRARAIAYGGGLIDQAIEQEKPDCYIAIQDPWAFNGYYNKAWFKQISSLFWVTVDSLPLLPEVVDQCKGSKEYWVWSGFAERELRRLGHTNVKTVHGTIEHKHFFKFTKEKKLKLRQMLGLDPNLFLIGFVFRNQLRKSVHCLLEGFKLFKERNPTIKNAKLLFHTYWQEGWDIYRLAAEYNVKQDEILTTHVCRECHNVTVHQYCGPDLNCKFCKKEKSVTTPNVAVGVTEDELNAVYNLMDVYCHPFTSGGQELPIQEAKFVELITLVTNYSCGEDSCEEGAGSYPLDWSENREFGTQFRKASTSPSCIAKQLTKVYNMSESDRSRMGKQARDWAIHNFSVESIGKIVENYIDECPKVDYGNVHFTKVNNPDAEIDRNLPDAEWIKKLYKEVLKLDENENTEGGKYWLAQLARGISRNDIEKYFKELGQKENIEKSKKNTFENLLGDEGKDNRVIFVIPESAGDVINCTALFPDIKETYPTCNLYVATKPEYKSILQGNKYVYKVLDFIPNMDSQVWLEGQGGHQGYFKMAFMPHGNSQRFLSYLQGGQHRPTFNLEIK